MTLLSLPVLSASHTLPGLGPPACRAAPPGQPLQEAAILVEANRLLGPASPLLFGTNISHPGHVNGIPDWISSEAEYREAMRKWYGYLPLVSELGPTILRFPGGLNANEYRWTRGIGPVLERRPMTDRKESPHPLIGTDEFLLFCEELGAQAMITVNLNRASGDSVLGLAASPESVFRKNAAVAADWVEYCNAPHDGSNPRGGTDWAAVRARNGHAAPYGVRYWELGNELQDMPASLYGRAVPVFSREMKAADPAIQVGVVDPLPGWPKDKVRAWFREVGEQNREFFDFWIHHSYSPGTTGKLQGFVLAGKGASITAPLEMPAADACTIRLRAMTNKGQARLKAAIVPAPGDRTEAAARFEAGPAASYRPVGEAKAGPLRLPAADFPRPSALGHSSALETAAVSRTAGARHAPIAGSSPRQIANRGTANGPALPPAATVRRGPGAGTAPMAGNVPSADTDTSAFAPANLSASQDPAPGSPPCVEQVWEVGRTERSLALEARLQAGPHRLRLELLEGGPLVVYHLAEWSGSRGGRGSLDLKNSPELFSVIVSGALAAAERWWSARELGEKPLFITEYNSLYEPFRRAPHLAAAVSLRDALNLGMYIQSFLRRGVPVATQWLLYGDMQGFGLIEGVGIDPTHGRERGRSDPRPRPGYHLLKLYREHQAGETVSVRVDSPGYRIGPPGPHVAMGYVNHVSLDIQYLQAVASRSPDGKRLYLVVQNLYPAAPLAARITLAGFSPEPLADQVLLSADFPWTSNEPESCPAGDCVQTRASTLPVPGPAFVHSFPPHSVTALAFLRAGTRREAMGPPGNLSARATPAGIEFTWSAPAGSEPAAYHLFRSRFPFGPFRHLVQRLPAGAARATDFPADACAPCTYAVRAVNSLGEEGPFSNKATVFWKGPAR